MIFSKVISRLQKRFYSIDEFNQEDNGLILKGWIFSKKGKINNVHFVIKDYQNKIHNLSGLDRITRNDVYERFLDKNAEQSGFYVSAMIENCPSYKVWIYYTLNGVEKKLYVGEIKNKNANTDKPVCITESLASSLGFNLHDEIKQEEKFRFLEEYSDEIVDVIIPVYNGYRFLEKLLSDVSHTNMKYRLILVDDCSPDERVYPFLKKYAEGKDNVLLLQNEKNLGFVQSVNRALRESNHNIALVNTDVELPDQWLERLMLPILKDEKIATSTPFTTCGTVCSFPDFFKDNALFLDLNVDEIDKEFINIKPKYISMPTGVGFCMGMSKKAINEVGLLDAETFGKGYGEENDWCQRAVELGYRNVQVENLFVYHNHGGSFSSHEKRKLLEEHSKLLLKKHPNYNADVARFFTIDPNKDIRDYVQLKLLCKYNSNYTILAFDHMLGGGATSYLEKKSREELEQHHTFVVVRYDYLKDLYVAEYRYEDRVIKFHVAVKEGIKTIIDYLNINEIWINELVTYPSFYATLNEIKESANNNNIPIRMLFHDFFAICPTINLINENDEYCDVPCYARCEQCLSKNEFVKGMNVQSLEKWRTEWHKFLLACREVVVFSENTESIVKKVYPDLDNIVLIPHQISYIPKLNKVTKTTKTLNVGLLGVLTKHKGEEIVRELIKLIDDQNLNIRIKLIGRAENLKDNRIFSQTGPYTRGSLPKLVLENDIDIFLIPSIWPETFSYTTEEVKTMGFPLMSFNLGAPADRIKKYEKGIIVPEMSAQSVLNVLQTNEIVKQTQKLPFEGKKVLFVVEDYTFATRYRVYHLQEQLLLKGYQSDCIDKKEIKNTDVSKYTSVVVYRCSCVNDVRNLYKKCHKVNIPVYYDIDDFIFDYSAITYLPFLKDEEYKDFKEYTSLIYKTMEICDGYITSTNSLQTIIKSYFPDKTVLINRNHASMEMEMLSQAKPNLGKYVTLGYFSGSNTHNEDFESIKNVLLRIMDRNEFVHLLLGGQIQLSPEFNQFKDRIHTFGFVDWKELPAIISEADINLMPLQNTEFHYCKSENKWMEAGLVSVPTIATSNPELDGIIHDGIDGILCHDQLEWERKLQLLVSDKDFRDGIAKNVHNRVINEYTTRSVEENIISLLVADKH